MQQSEITMTDQIFQAAERLVAKGGVHGLSMHKLAKEANISAGTIYLYFKNKEELLVKLVRREILFFLSELEKGDNRNLPYFERYHNMWWNIWRYLQKNPVVLGNMNQYFVLPEFAEICAELESESYWVKFCQQAIADQAICDMPTKVLFSLTLGVAIDLASHQVYFNLSLSDALLNDVIDRTWRSIQK